MPNQQVQLIPTRKLEFDPQNPRFYRLNDSHSVGEVIEEMLDDESVQDLMLSIGQKGYFEGEPLLVVRSSGGAYTVVEGNRRLAAVKLLNREISPPTRRQNSVAVIREEAVVPPPTSLPCLVYDSRREVLRYLGYRHITGIKEWDSLSKAKYLSELRTEFYAAQPEAEQLRSLARDIGSRTGYVGQLLTALSLYIRAEEKKFFRLPINADGVEFSYITTALNYKTICAWLGLDGKNDIEMRSLDERNLKKMFAWFFAKDQQGRTILGESRNLSELAAIVTSGDAIKVLETTGRLSEAYLYTDGPEVALSNALDQVNERLRVVWNMMPGTRPLTSSHLEQAEQAFVSCKDIRGYLRDKLEG
jgi:hypothetical protein